MGMFPSSQSANGRASERRSPRPSDRSLTDNKSKAVLPIIPGTGSNPDEPIDLTILADVPGWLRSLRLHKYTPTFEGSNWRDMVLMDDAALEAKGVAALGARRKLLKVFENVRIQQNIPVSYCVCLVEMHRRKRLTLLSPKQHPPGTEPRPASPGANSATDTNPVE